ncbi:hypothetical protein NHX12_011937 [Muraenolepis orangiensis]|uniref:Uncharacterized protein n=1 Tax=Muraenolepis orangiensis TaxID=630683 RepID=A0A9Q0DH83_9TELE|nr:hypothetical protein NHX12_011937 [Muraenolepis orangiensis]
MEHLTTIYNKLGALEASASDPYSALPAQRPQHSLSCSNILEVRTGFRQDEGSEPIVFATVKRSAPQASSYGRTEGRSRRKELTRASSLDRGQSRSDEGLLQTSEDEVAAGGQRMRGALYKTASFGRSVALSEENLVLGASGRPRRGVSSNQVPGKGILKNQKPQPDIRKAKSMEVLSSRVAKGQGKGADKGKGTTPAEMETARESFVQGKLQFSSFLDEITKQVISPSNLNILGVNHFKCPAKTPEPVRGPGAAKPQPPVKKHRQSCSGEEREQQHKPPATQEKIESLCNSPSHHSTSSARSDPDRLTTYVARRHRGSPPPHPHPQSSSHHPPPGGKRQEEKSPVIAGHKARESDLSRGSHFTDGASTSSEPVLPNKRNPGKHRNASPRSPPPTHPHPHLPHIHPRHGYTSSGYQEEGQGHGGYKSLGSAPGVESEPGSCKSDSPRTRAATTNSQSSDQSVRHRSNVARKGHTDHHHKVLLGSSDQFQALQEENTDLHQNLLQTVVCIESLEAELDRTREELSHFKDNLLETHTGPRQIHTMLGEHLAGLLEKKHFDPAEEVQKFLKTASAVSHPKTPPPPPPDPSPPGASSSSEAVVEEEEEAPRDWLASEAGPRRATAFMPWKQGASADDRSGAHGQPFSIADISAAIYKKIAAQSSAANLTSSRPKPPQGCRPEGTNHTGPPAAHVGQQQAVPETAELAPGLGDVTYLSAQQALDEFMNQLGAHRQGAEEQQVSHI